MTRLMSFCTMPSMPMNSAPMAPMMIMNDRAVSDCSNTGENRATMKMPAVTMVAAWISAEMGVGPSMESGSQACSGTWADLPMAPTNSEMHATVSNCQRSEEHTSELQSLMRN